jgi:hypothetical protein
VGFVPSDGALPHPERVSSSPEKLNEDEAKGRTLKNTFTPSQINSVYMKLRYGTFCMGRRFQG